MDLIQKASKLGYKHYTEFTVGGLDKLPISNNSKQIEYCFLQRWLRETHNIHISIDYGELSNKYMGTINSVNNRTVIELECIYCTYEEALEEGLTQSLKLIKL